MNLKNLFFTLGTAVTLSAIPAFAISCSNDENDFETFEWNHFFTNDFLLDENLEINDVDNQKWIDVPGLFAASVLSSEYKKEAYLDLVYVLADRMQVAFSDADNNKNNWESNFLDDSEIDFKFDFNFGDKNHLKIDASSTLNYIVNNISSWTAAPAEFVQVSNLVDDSFFVELEIPETSTLDRSVLETDDRHFTNNLDEYETELIESSTKRLITMIIDNAFKYLVDPNKHRKWELRDKDSFTPQEMITSLFSENQVREYWLDIFKPDTGVEGRIIGYPFPVSFWNKTGFDGSVTEYDVYAVDNAIDQVEEVNSVYNYLLFSIFNMDADRNVSHAEAAIIMTETEEQNTLVIDEDNLFEDFGWGYYKYGEVDEEGNKPDVPNRPYFAFSSKYNIYSYSVKQLLENVDSHFAQIKFVGAKLGYDVDEHEASFKADYIYDHSNYDDTTKTVSKDMSVEFAYEVHGGTPSIDNKLDGALEKFMYSGQLVSKMDADSLKVAFADPDLITPIETVVDDFEMNGIESDEFIANIERAMINNVSNWYGDEAYGDTNKLFNILGVKLLRDKDGEITIRDDFATLQFIFTHVLDSDEEIIYTIEMRLE